MKKRQKEDRRKKGKAKGEFCREEDALAFSAELSQMKKQLEKVLESTRDLQERLEDAEIHINLLTRLITTLCVEKLGMRIGVLKRLLKRIEQEAIRDSQILHLESLYKLSHHPSKKKSSHPHSRRRDPWEDIS